MDENRSILSSGARLLQNFSCFLSFNKAGKLCLRHYSLSLSLTLLMFHLYAMYVAWFELLRSRGFACAHVLTAAAVNLFFSTQNDLFVSGERVLQVSIIEVKPKAKTDCFPLKFSFVAKVFFSFQCKSNLTKCKQGPMMDLQSHHALAQRNTVKSIAICRILKWRFKWFFNLEYPGFIV